MYNCLVVYVRVTLPKVAKLIETTKGRLLQKSHNSSESTTYRYGTMSGKTVFHVDISKSPRGEFLFSTWGRKNSSEESNETSEELNDAHVENKKYPRGDLRFSTWIFEKGGLEVRDYRLEIRGSGVTHYIMTSFLGQKQAEVSLMGVRPLLVIG